MVVYKSNVFSHCLGSDVMSGLWWMLDLFPSLSLVLGMHLHLLEKKSWTNKPWKESLSGIYMEMRTPRGEMYSDRWYGDYKQAGTRNEERGARSEDSESIIKVKNEK